MKSNNPDGRPNVLVDPVRITITIEGKTSCFITHYAIKHRLSKSEVLRKIISREIEVPK